MGTLLMIHPKTGDVQSFHKPGEGVLAVQARRDGYNAMSERTNDMLDRIIAREDRSKED